MIHSLRYRLLSLLPLLLSAAAPASGQDFQSHASIVEAAERHLEQSFAQQADQLQIEITPLDHRLRLSPCDTELGTFDPPGGIGLGLV